jgi:hypothetical protein
VRKNSGTKVVHVKTGKRKRSACKRGKDEMLFEPDRKMRRRYVNNSRSLVAACPQHVSAAGVQRVEITEGGGYRLELAGHADDGHCSADEGEQVAGHSSVDNINDGDEVKCLICQVTFTALEIATPYTCNHTFCAVCLQEWPKNENNCPVDRQMFNFILVWHHFGGEIITRIPVEPAMAVKRVQS